MLRSIATRTVTLTIGIRIRTRACGHWLTFRALRPCRQRRDTDDLFYGGRDVVQRSLASCSAQLKLHVSRFEQVRTFALPFAECNAPLRRVLRAPSPKRNDGAPSRMRKYHRLHLQRSPQPLHRCISFHSMSSLLCSATCRSLLESSLRRSCASGGERLRCAASPS